MSVLRTVLGLGLATFFSCRFHGLFTVFTVASLGFTCTAVAGIAVSSVFICAASVSAIAKTVTPASAAAAASAPFARAFTLWFALSAIFLLRAFRGAFLLGAAVFIARSQ